LECLGQAKSKGKAPLFLVSKQNLTLFIDTFKALKFVKNGIELRKLCPLKLEGVKNSKNEPSNITKANFQRPKKILIYRFVVIRAQK
jgi:hypothetical protein